MPKDLKDIKESLKTAKQEYNTAAIELSAVEDNSTENEMKRIRRRIFDMQGLLIDLQCKKVSFLVKRIKAASLSPDLIAQELRTLEAKLKKTEFQIEITDSISEKLVEGSSLNKEECIKVAQLCWLLKSYKLQKLLLSEASSMPIVLRKSKKEIYMKLHKFNKKMWTAEFESEILEQSFNRLKVVSIAQTEKVRCLRSNLSTLASAFHQLRRRRNDILLSQPLSSASTVDLLLTPLALVQHSWSLFMGHQDSSKVDATGMMSVRYQYCKYDEEVDEAGMRQHDASIYSPLQ